ncbi:hypothetical protein [Halomarina rubra]|uniref:Uncharacterized protein n=1 Tax=Halomarina rubra TaxID=2071873 RepID=A0ABD6AU88_9EURY|nr:hypothetical protein [Halomarina rubra]
MNRRALLAMVGALGASTLAGCSTFGDADLPAGTLRFVNDDDLPHTVGFEVTAVGAEPGDDGPGSVTGDADAVVPERQRELTASVALDAGESRTYEDVFAYPVWYGVRFTVDGEDPDNDSGRTAYNPAPPDWDTGRVLGGRVYEDGDLGYFVSGTSNPGSFTLGASR